LRADCSSTDLEDDVLVCCPLGQLASQLDPDDFRALEFPRQAWDIKKYSRYRISTKWKSQLTSLPPTNKEMQERAHQQHT
jgi:hypothetical protein